MRLFKNSLHLTLALALFGAGTAAAVDPVFDPSRLHEVKVEIDPADWAALKATFQTNQYYAANVTIDGEQVRQVGIRSRGKGSRSGTKPGIKIDMNKYVAGQAFHSYKSIQVLNSIQDASFLHDLLTYSVYEAVGIAAPQIAPTKMFVNGDYVGLYLLEESVEKQFLRTRVGEDGGTLYKYEYTVPYTLTYKNDSVSAYVPDPFKPETNDSSFDSGLADFIKAVNQTPQSTFTQTISSYIDPQKVLTYLAVENAVAEYDGFVGEFGLNNFYLYQLAGTKKFMLIPWDKDGSFHAAEWPVLQRLDANELTKRLIVDPALKSYYLSQVKAIATNFVTTAFLSAKVDQIYPIFKDAAFSDPLKPYSSADIEASIAGLKGLIAARAGNVTAQIP
ncbi:MAG: CotH kinase family protein [Vicinamibacteria bacterium]